MNENDLQKLYNYPIYPRDSTIYSDKGFVFIDNGAQEGTHWTCIIVKYKKSYYFDSFNGQPDKFLLNQLPKPIKYHNYKIQGMPNNVFGGSFHDNINKIDTSLFVQKPYLRTNYIESNIEDDIDLKKQFRSENLPDPISIREAYSKNYVDNLFNDPSIMKNSEHIELNDRNITNARFF